MQNTWADTTRPQPAATDALMEEVVRGLQSSPPMLPPKLFYDERGSALFDEICELPEYYLTRAEWDILERNAGEMAALMSRRVLLMELGSGSSRKIRPLLERGADVAAYVPVDISYEHMVRAAAELSELYPALDIHPLCADYTRSLALPQVEAKWGRVVYFYPGSTIGNHTPRQARELLGRLRRAAGARSALLVGVDLKKDRAVLEAAYNDSRGVTARFNLNMLSHLNDLLHTDFDLDAWRHRAVYNVREGRIEMHLVCRRPQTVRVGERLFRFEPGMHIVTEYSYKYTLEEFTRLASPFFEAKRIWTDRDGLFSVLFMEAS